MDKSACKEYTPDKREDGKDIFFPERGEARLANEAQAVCLHCPVFKECKDYQARLQNKYGIWAATRFSPG